MPFDSTQWAADILGCERNEAERRLSAASKPKPLRSIEAYEEGGAYRRLCMAAENGDKRARAALLDIERSFAENAHGTVRVVYSRDTGRGTH